MERTRWTDDVLDQRIAAMDEKFDRLFTEIHVLREEMRAGFAELRGELVAVQRQLIWIIGAFALGLLGLLATAQL